MSFQSGTISYRPFVITGGPTTPTEALIEKLKSGVIHNDAVGAPADAAAGFCGGRHAGDVDFSFANNVVGDNLIFALRVDTNRVPGDLKKAFTLAQETAARAESVNGFISKAQKRVIKEEVAKLMEEEQKSGRHRRSKVVPIMWDLARGKVYANATGDVADLLMERFEFVLGLNLVPRTITRIAADFASVVPEADTKLADMKPAPLMKRPGFPEPVYPWFIKKPQHQGYLANEFAFYLWHVCAVDSGELPINSDQTVSVMIDRTLELADVFDGESKDTFRGVSPHSSPEARRALGSGKGPRSFGLTLATSDSQFTLTFKPESMSIGGLKLPKFEGDAAAELQGRLDELNAFDGAILGAVRAFIDLRTSDGWAARQADMVAWIAESSDVVAEVEEPAEQGV